MDIRINKIKINEQLIIGEDKLTLIAGPCAIESEEMSLQVAKALKEVCDRLDINYLFKSSFDKANRSSIHSPRGVGLEEGLRILKKVKEEVGVPVVTDVHEPWQCEKVAEVVDVLQIPAFLARQTDLLVAAAKTGKIVNVKKGQFMAPWDMKNIVTKMQESGNENVMLCERGTSFGYNNLVVDMTGLIEMKKLGCPVVFDATHSVQKPGGQGASTGGNRDFVAPLAKAAAAVGIDVLFAEVHPDPDNAFSDGPNQLKLEGIEQVLSEINAIYKLGKKS